MPSVCRNLSAPRLTSAFQMQPAVPAPSCRHLRLCAGSHPPAPAPSCRDTSGSAPEAILLRQPHPAETSPALRRQSSTCAGSHLRCCRRFSSAHRPSPRSHPAHISTPESARTCGSAVPSRQPAPVFADIRTTASARRSPVTFPVIPSSRQSVLFSSVMTGFPITPSCPSVS